jgi:hypothetical protein
LLWQLSKILCEFRHGLLQFCSMEFIILKKYMKFVLSVITQYHLMSFHQLTFWHWIKCPAGYAEEQNLNDCIREAITGSQQ